MLIDLQRAMLSACYGDPAGFTRALLHLAPASVPVEKALYVHTATVTASLTAVLAQAYPGLEAWLGPAAFAQAALTHLRTNPPGPALLSAYGAGFGRDLPDPGPVLAAADWAAHQAYFAADAVLMPIAALAAPGPAGLEAMRLPTVPSLALVTGDAATLRQWLALRPDIRRVEPVIALDGADATAVIWRGEDLLVAAMLLPPDAGNFIRALGEGAGLAVAAATLALPDHLSPLLALVFGQGMIATTTGTNDVMP